MPKNYANLDALIERAHFEAPDDGGAESLAGIAGGASVVPAQLEGGQIFRTLLRKPDFQRETANWEPEKVAGLVQSFVEGSFIPAVILWASPAKTVFVIDGAHRLSAIMAWISDDYGDSTYSRKFFGSYDDPRQKKAAKETRDLVRESVGTYEQLNQVLRLQDQDPVLVSRARSLGLAKLSAQWIDGNVKAAEKSFFAINQQATPIDPTELSMIRARNGCC